MKESLILILAVAGVKKGVTGFRGNPVRVPNTQVNRVSVENIQGIGTIPRRAGVSGTLPHHHLLTSSIFISYCLLSYQLPPEKTCQS